MAYQDCCINTCEKAFIGKSAKNKWKQINQILKIYNICDKYCRFLSKLIKKIPMFVYNIKLLALRCENVN